MIDALCIHGDYLFRCWLGDELLWEREIHNVVATVGKNLAFNTFLNGSGYTVTGPYMGLIDAAGFSAVAASDTMASHPGWNEATYTASRQTCNWAAAINGSISTAGPLNFFITTAGVTQGAFIVYGSGAFSVVNNTGGTLWSAGAFAGGPATVPLGSILQVNYTASM